MLPAPQLTLQVVCKPKVFALEGLCYCLGGSQLCFQEGHAAARWSDDNRVGQGNPLVAIVISALAPNHSLFFLLTITIAALCCVR